jgi:hypothetical protein
MTATVTAFRKRLKEFADTTAFVESDIQDKLDTALTYFSADYFGDLADEAQILLAAHFYTEFDPDKGAVDPLVQSASAGGASVSYVRGGDAEFGSTKYGLAFERVRCRVGGGNVLAY